jgi:nitroreductase
MTGQFPDVETVRTALSLATRAPSIHNSQPWGWKAGEHSLQLYADGSRHLLRADPDQRDLLVSCGASLHHAIVALSALGWQSKVQRFPDPAEPNHLASIEVLRREPSEADVALAAAIPRRRTDRRFFSYWPVPRADIATIGVRVARMGIQLRRVEMTIDIKAIVASAVWQHIHDDEYLAELTTWSGRYASTAGVPARSIPEPDQQAPLPGRVFAGAALAQPASAIAAHDHAVLLALGTATDDRLARLRAGEATSMALLTATSMGLATCPVTEPLELEQTREAIRSEVFGETDHPQVMLRIGWAPIGADPLPATPRRPMNEVVSALDGSPLR